MSDQVLDTSKNLSQKVSCVLCRVSLNIRCIDKHYKRKHDNFLFDKWHKNHVEKEIQKYFEQNLQHSYSLNPKICSECSSYHSYDKRNNLFCSASCGAKNSNKRRGKRSQESKNKTSVSIKLWRKENPELEKERVKRSWITRKLKIKENNEKLLLLGIRRKTHGYSHKCSVCEVIIFSTRVTCSSTCHSHHMSLKFKETRRKSGRKFTKSCWYVSPTAGRCYLESSWELKVAEDLDRNNIVWIRPKYLKYHLDGKTKSYYPDFYLCDYDAYLDPKK